MIGLKQKHNSDGFSLIELLVTVTVMALFAGMIIPVYTEAQDRNRIRSTGAEIESRIKVARNYSLTGQIASINQLPTGGYGVFVSMQSDTITYPILNYQHAVSFIDHLVQNNFIDSGEYSITSDVLDYYSKVTTYSLRGKQSSNGTCSDLTDAVVIYQPPRADVVLRGTIAGAQQDLDTLTIKITINNSASATNQQVIEVIKATGKIEFNPTSTTC